MRAKTAEADARKLTSGGLFGCLTARLVEIVSTLTIGTVSASSNTSGLAEIASACRRSRAHVYRRSLLQARSCSGMAVARRSAFALLSQSAHAPFCVRSTTHKVEEGKVPRNALPNDASMPLSFEAETVVVLIVLYIWAGPWGWFAELASTLHNSAGCGCGCWLLVIVVVQTVCV